MNRMARFTRRYTLLRRARAGVETVRLCPGGTICKREQIEIARLQSVP